MKLLVVDFDFFFPTPEGTAGANWQLFDWGHMESPYFIEGPIWISRAAAFSMAGVELPSLSRELKYFWDRVKFNPGAELFYADSNACAVHPRVERGITEVFLLDAHHDSGYTGNEYTFKDLGAMGRAGKWTCDNWMAFYFITGRLTEVRYPRWRDSRVDGEPSLRLANRGIDDGWPIREVDRVFVCRSGAWVPPWHDRAFAEFLVSCPVASVDRPGTNVQLNWTLVREWDDKSARQFAELQRASVESFHESMKG